MGDPCNLIGSQQCDLFTNHTIFCSKSNVLNRSIHVLNRIISVFNHNYNKILKSDWLSTALIPALIGQYASCLSNWTVHAITRALKGLFLTASEKKIGIILF